MKKVSCLLLLLLAGCGGSAPEPEADVSSCPPGMGLLKDAPNGVPEGTRIYGPDGALYGTIRGYETDHKFPNGYVGMGTQVELAGGGPKVTVWTDSEVLSANRYMKRP